MTALNRRAVLVDHLPAAVVVAPHIIGCAFAVDADKRLALALACALIPVAVVQAVCFVDVPLHFGGDARAPGFGPRRAVVVERLEVAQVIVAGLVGLRPQVRRGLAAEAATVGPVVIRRDRQRQVVLQLPALGERGVDAFEGVAVELVGRRQQTGLVRRGFRVILAPPVGVELRLAQGVVVVVFLVVVLDRGQCGVAAAVFKQAAPLDLVAAQRAFAAPLVAFQVRGRDPGLEAAEITGIDPHESLAQVVGADDLLGKHPGFFGRPKGDHADVATAGADVRAVGFRRALGGKHFREVFRVAQLVGIDAVVARIVDRHAIDGNPDLVGVHAAHGEVGAAGATGVITGNVDARRVFELVDGVGGRRHLVHGFLGHRRPRLGTFFADHVAVAQGLFAGDVHRADVLRGVCQNQWRKAT
ncbi:hypothetical protein [Pseudomonas sp. 22 E 5]|nr:hypothetical protein [Pseudomonas sp. 22 E 5]